MGERGACGSPLCTSSSHTHAPPTPAQEDTPPESKLQPGSGGIKVRAVAGFPSATPPNNKDKDNEGAQEADNVPDEWTIAYLYDGACPVCQGLKKMLTRTDRAHHIAFINLAR